MKVLVFHQPWPMGNYKYNTAIAKELSEEHEVYLLEQLNGRPASQEYIDQIINLDLDVAYFDMLDAETFKIVEQLKCKKVLAYNTGGIYGYDEILEYKDKLYTHVYTNSLLMKDKFKKAGVPVESYEWFLNCLPEEEMQFDAKFNHDCVFLGMGFGRVSSPDYQLERDLYFSGFNGEIDFHLYGNGWPQYNFYRGVLPPDEIGKLYSSAKSGFALIAKGQREKGMINNRYSEMGSCGIPIVSYDYDTIDWFGAKTYINFISSKQEAIDTVKDILSGNEIYKLKSEKLKEFTQQQHKVFFEKLSTLINS